MPVHCLDHLRAERQVRDEAAIHDVDVQPVGAPLLATAKVGRQLREVGTEERGGDQGAGADLQHCDER